MIISVITVTYNAESGLKKTCENVAGQTDVAIEHIIIDGASTDGTRDFLESYSRRPFVKSISEPDRGIFDAMNKGLGVATGDLIVFMNAGDTFARSDTLHKVGESFEKLKWDWAYGAVRYVKQDGADLGVIQRSGHRQRRLELGLTFVPHQTMYVSRKIATSLGDYRFEYGMAADQDYAIRAGLLAQPHVIPEVLCDFEIGGAHGNLARIEREMIFHRIRRRNNILILGSTVVDRVFAFLNGLRWATRDVASSVYHLRRVGR